jgi:tetratricopeptide (TPR) repeat protein
VLAEKGENEKLAELYAAAAPHQSDRREQLRFLHHASRLFLAVDEERAVRLCQEIQRLDPHDVAARRVLEDYYDKAGRLADLARILEGALTAPAGLPDDEVKMTRFRLMSLYAGGLGEMERALPHAEELLAMDPAHGAARVIASELLSHKPLAARAAAALGAALEKTGELQEAAQHYALEIEHLRGPRRIEVQKQLSALYHDKLGDLERSFALDEAVLPLDPGDNELRARYLASGATLDKQVEVSRVLARAATGARDPGARARISADLGDVLAAVGDARKAKVAYQNALEGQADEGAALRAARALAAMATEGKDPQGLAAALAKLAELEPEAEARLEAAARLAHVCEDELDDAAGAVAAYRLLLGTPLEGEALTAMERHFTRSGGRDDLAEVLERRATLENDPAAARALSFRAVEMRTEQLADRGAALAAWQAHLAAHGSSREALARVMPLLEHERRWEELAAALDSDAALAPREERPGIFSRLGQVRLGRLGDAEGALAAHREALAIDPGDRVSRLALDKMLAAGELRLAAAEVLEPVARAEEAWTVLVRVLEARSMLVDGLGPRLAALAEAVEIAEQQLHDDKRALELSARGLELAVSAGMDEEPAWIARVVRLSAADSWRGAEILAEALGERSVEDPVSVLLATRAGEALAQVGEQERALSIFRRALAADPSSPELLGRVDGILAAQGSPAERLALHRGALAHAGDPARRRALRHAIGAIERRDLGDRAAALLTYREALEEDASDEAALEALLALHEAASDWAGLEGELGSAADRASGSAKISLVLRLAALLGARGQLDRAALRYRELMALEPSLDDELLASIEGVARSVDDAELLRALFERRISGALQPEQVATWSTELGELLLTRFDQPEAAADALLRAAEAAGHAGDAPRAARLLARVLALRPGDRAAATRLSALHREAGAWGELTALGAQLVRTAPSAEEAAQLLFGLEEPAVKAGAVDRFLAESDALLSTRGEELSAETRAALRTARARVLAADPARHAEILASYRAILESGEGDTAAAAEALEALLRAGGAAAGPDLRWLFQWRAARAVEGERVALFLAWAEVEEKLIGDASAAAELYEKVIAIDPEHDQALAAKIRLLLDGGDTEGALAAIALRRDQAEGEARAALELSRAELLLTPLGRAGEALSAVSAVLSGEPSEAVRTPALALVQRLLGLEETRDAAVALLERGAEASGDAAASTAMVELLLSAEAGDADQRAARRDWLNTFLARPGLPPERALDLSLRALARMPLDIEGWERAEKLARATQQVGVLAQAYRQVLGVGAKERPRLEGHEPDAVEELGRRAVEYHEEWFDEPETVVALLRRIVEITYSPAARADGEAGEAPPPIGSAWAFERLKLTFNLSERWDDLFALYDEVLAVTFDRDTRRELLEDAALAAKDLAGDASRAMGYFEALLALRDEARIRTALERLYERHGRHRPLITLLEGQLAALSGDAAQKLRARIAGLWLDGVGEPLAAVLVIEQLIAAEPDRPEAFELLERVMAATEGGARSAEATAARRRAASLLKESYRKQGRVGELIRVLEIELEAAETPAERAERIRGIVRLRLELGDLAGAFEDTSALLLLEPAEAAHRVELTRLAASLGRQVQLAEALGKAAALAEGSNRIALLAQAAAVHRSELGNAARATELNRAILADAPAGDPAALRAARDLDQLLAEQGLAAERCDVLEQLATMEPEAAARRAARAELARIAWAEVGDPERAIRAFRAALAEDAGDEAARAGLIEALERIARWDELIEALEARAARAEGAAARQDRVRAARILEERSGDLDGAIRAWAAIRKGASNDEESADALASLLEKTSRWDELVALLEEEAMAASAPDRVAELWRHVGDLHLERTGKWGEAIAAYELALEQRGSDPAARLGLETLVSRLDPVPHRTTPEAGTDEERRAALASAVAVLGRLYGAADDWQSLVSLLGPRLAAAADDAAKIAILTETAGLLEHRRNDAAGAFDAVWRAFSLSPTAALGAEAIRLADGSDRWTVIATALAAGFDTRPEVTAEVARALWWKAALWQRDRRGDLAAAEAAFLRALERDPGSIELLSALAEVQRRAPGSALVGTLLRLAEATGAHGDLDLYGEAIEVAEQGAGDPAAAKQLAEKLFATARARWEAAPEAGEISARFGTFERAAAWALEVLLRLSAGGDPQQLVALYLHGAALPFAAAERRRLRLAAAEIAEVEARISIYAELFAEDPRDTLASERLDALYAEQGQSAARIALREQQIAVAEGAGQRVALRFERATLLVAQGDASSAIAALRENLAEAPGHAPSIERLAALLEEGGHHHDLVVLSEERAAKAELEGQGELAAQLWAKAATLSEQALGDVVRAIADHRRALGLGAPGSADALARLLSARGEHAAAAEVLEQLCAEASAAELHLFALRLTDAHLAAGNAAAAREGLERAIPRADQGATLRDRLAELYRSASEWGKLADLIAEAVASEADPVARGARLREAAELHWKRRGDPVAAIPFLQQAADLAPEDSALRRELSTVLIAGGRLEEAATALRAVIAAYGTRRPKDRALAHFELARVTLATGDRAVAVSELDLALKIDPANPEILQTLARLALEEGQLDRAARNYRALLLVMRKPRDEAGPAAVSRAEVLFDLREIARLQGDEERAAEYLESAFEAARESAEEGERLLSAMRARKSYDLLARALETRLTSAAGAEAASLWDELSSLYEEHLGRPEEAFDARLRVLGLSTPTAARLAAARDLALRAGKIDRYLEAVAGFAEQADDPERAIDLHLALGQAYELDALDDRRAAAAYQKAEASLAARADQRRLEEVFRALDRIYERLGDLASLGDLLEKRVSAEESGEGGAALADPLYRLATLRLSRPDTQAEGLTFLARAQAAEPRPDQAEAALRAALLADPRSVPVLRALEQLARSTGRERTLIDVLVLLWERSAPSASGPASLAPESLEPARGEGLREAVEIAARLGDEHLVEDLLERVLSRAAIEGDAGLGWALLAMARRCDARGELGLAAAFKERVARSDPSLERALLLEVAALAAGPLADLARAARLYEELRAREPGEREIWQPLVEIYRILDDHARLGQLLDETAPLLDSAAERGALRLERARMAVHDDQEKAIAILKELLEDDPTHVEAATLLSDLLEKHGRKAELGALVARQIDAAKDRRDTPAIVALSLRLGLLLEQQWDENGALDVYHAALDWDADNRDLLRAIVRIGVAREDSVDLGGSLEKLLAVEEGEAATELALRLSKLRLLQGDAEGAEQALELGFHASPSNRELRDELVQRYTAAEAWPKLSALYVREAEGLSAPEQQVESLCHAADLLRERAGDPAGAAALLLRALELLPAERDVLLALIDAYGAMGEHEKAIDAISRVLTIHPDDPWLYRSRAALHEALGQGELVVADLQEAYDKSGGGYAGELVVALEQAVAQAAGRSSERPLRLRLAELLGKSGEVERARAELTELTRTDGKDRAALRALAALEDAQQSWEAAAAVYRRLLPLEEGEGLVDIALRLSLVCDQTGRPGDARAALERALRASPDHPELRERLRAVYNMTGAVHELAGMILEDAAASTDPATRFTHLLHAGRLLLDDGNEPARAVAVIEEARALRPDEQETTLLLAEAYAVGGRIPQARALLDAAAAAHKGRRSKQLSAVHRQRARLELAAGDKVAALGALTRAFEGDPQNGALAMELGVLAVELDEVEVLSRAFRAVTLMKVSPAGSAEGTSVAARGLAYYHLGRIAFAQGDKRKARMLIEKAAADDPGHEAARALLEQLKLG